MLEGGGIEPAVMEYYSVSGAVIEFDFFYVLYA